jgi:hypothetical protein
MQILLSFGGLIVHSFVNQYKLEGSVQCHDSNIPALVKQVCFEGGLGFELRV